MKKLKEGILTECEDDHVGLWSVIRDVESYFPDQGEEALGARVLEVLTELLVADEIEAGFPTETDGGFRRLMLPPEKIVERINDEWAVGSRPSIGEVMWFTKERNGGKREPTPVRRHQASTKPPARQRSPAEAGT